MQTTELMGLPYLEVGDLVEDIADQSKQFVTGVESVMLSNDFRGLPGDQGEPGPPGLPGVNAVPADEAVAAFVAATDTGTHAALKATFGDDATATLVGDSTSATGAAVRALTAQAAVTDDAVAQQLNSQESESRASVMASARAVSGMYNVVDFGAVGDGVTDDSPAIQAALYAARGKGKVLIPPGNYGMLTLLRVPRDTHILMHGATLHRRPGCFNMMVNWLSGDSFGGYDGHGGITIEGGVLDAHGGEAGQQGNNMVTFSHAANIRVIGVTFRRCQRFHALEFNGVNGGLAQDCIFEGWFDQDATGGTKEAIQIDFAGTTPDLPLGDGTMSKDIIVDGCTMRPYGAMAPHGIFVGGHSGAVGKFYDGIRVTNNLVVNALKSAITPYQWRGAVIAGNQIQNPGGSGISMNNSTLCTVANNTISTPTGSGIYLSNSDNITMAGNVINDGAGEGITLSTSSIWCTVATNKIRGCQSYGLVFTNGANHSAAVGNHIVGAGSNTTAFGVFRVSGNTHGVSIAGNVCRKRGTGTEAAAGVSVQAGSNDTWVSGNDFLGLPVAVTGTATNSNNRI